MKRCVSYKLDTKFDDFQTSHDATKPIIHWINFYNANQYKQANTLEHTRSYIKFTYKRLADGID